ncbi:hypothetical protein ABW19_dt0200614 [Dactylella cylindrospora]|nr:hypothetical protein ABW19_dt0200614 [Dactylella cylindrospora]
MTDRPIKQEYQDTLFDSINYEVPQTSVMKGRDPQLKSSLFQSSSGFSNSGFGSSAKVISDIGGIPFTMETKAVDEYLSTEGPPLPVKTAKSPARAIPPPAFSPLPEDLPQDPDDLIKVIGERSNTNHVSDLYEYIQSNAPKYSVLGFDFTEVHQQQFSVVLRLRGIPGPIEPPEPKLFPSKKAAKEYIAKIALDKLKAIPPEPEFVQLTGKTKGESYLGELNKYCSQNGLPRPHLVETSNSKAPFKFGCEIKMSISGDQSFGSLTPNWPNKKAAQNAAAHAALEWINKEKPTIVKTKGKSGRSGKVLIPGSYFQIDATGKTIGEVATEACVLLGFKAPQRQLEPVPDMLGMYNVYVTLEHGDSISHVGPIKNIFGKKSAGEEAMKVTLRTVQVLAKTRFDVTLEVTGKKEFEDFQ